MTCSPLAIFHLKMLTALQEAALERANSGNVTSVSVDGTSTTWGSTAELDSMIQYHARKYAQHSGSKPRQSTINLSRQF